MEFQDEPITYADWDGTALSASFELFAAFIHGNATTYLVEDQAHDEMLFFMTGDGKGTMVTIQGKHIDRAALSQWVRDYITAHQIYAVVHVCESWVKFADSPNDKGVRQIQFREIKESEIKPEHRTEVLSVSAQSWDGAAVNWVDEILRHKKKGTLKLGPCHQFGGLEGWFGTLFAS